MSSKNVLKTKNFFNKFLTWVLDIAAVLACMVIAFLAFDHVTHDALPVANWIFAIVIGAFLGYLFYLNQDLVLNWIVYVLIFAVVAFVAYIILFHLTGADHQVISGILSVIVSGCATAYWVARHPAKE